MRGAKSWVGWGAPKLHHFTLNLHDNHAKKVPLSTGIKHDVVDKIRTFDSVRWGSVVWFGCMYLARPKPLDD